MNYSWKVHKLLTGVSIFMAWCKNIVTPSQQWRSNINFAQSHQCEVTGLEKVAGIIHYCIQRESFYTDDKDCTELIAISQISSAAVSTTLSASHFANNIIPTSIQLQQSKYCQSSKTWEPNCETGISAS